MPRIWTDDEVKMYSESIRLPVSNHSPGLDADVQCISLRPLDGSPEDGQALSLSEPIVNPMSLVTHDSQHVMFVIDQQPPKEPEMCWLHSVLLMPSEFIDQELADMLQVGEPAARTGEKTEPLEGLMMTGYLAKEFNTYPGDFWDEIDSFYQAQFTGPKVLHHSPTAPSFVEQYNVRPGSVLQKQEDMQMCYMQRGKYPQEGGDAFHARKTKQQILAERELFAMENMLDEGGLLGALFSE